MGSVDIAMHGMMMKKKSKANLLGNKWVMRYFILYHDGKLVYYHDKPELDTANGDKNSEVLCDNIGECTVDVVKASDLAGHIDLIANSFYITGKGRGKVSMHRTLLVTNGPKEFKQWMLAFRKMKAEMLQGVDKQIEESENIKSTSDKEEIVPHQISFDAAGVNGIESKTTTVDKTASELVGVRFAADVDITTKETKDEQEDGKSVTFSIQDSEFIRDAVISEAISGDEKSVTFSDRSVTFSDRDDVISGDRSVTFSDYGDEIINDDVSFDNDDSSIPSEIHHVDGIATNDATASVLEEDKEVSEDKVYTNKTRASDEAMKAAEKSKVFAYGDFYDEMTEALDENKILFGVIFTSVEEILDDEAYLKTEPRAHHSELTPICIKFTGRNAHFNGTNNHAYYLDRMESFSQKCCNLNRFNPIIFDDRIEARNRILNLLGQPKELTGVKPDLASSTMSPKSKQLRPVTFADTGGLTAYKHALNVQGADGVPDGPELLKIVREPLGAPYNWVLFQPSEVGLIVEDAGSGGVMELAKIVHRDYNDQVLFGLSRVSFAGDLGLRQFWCALEWKGESASGVKALKSYNECLAPMADLIGDRSFTLSNSSAMDLSPQIVVDFVKKSCNVEFLDVTVHALGKGHELEQKTIDEYWGKLEAKEKAKEDARNAEKLKQEVEKREASLKYRALQLAKTKQKRLTREKRWSKMNAKQLLENLMIGDISGWVLLQANIQK